ncbi:hypothetical protein CJI97_002963 [Candidozyma auris]|nr:hypothetical protein CJI97_002963 [[Candida] auris]
MEHLTICKYEAENREQLLRRHFLGAASDENRQNVIFDLKRREAQLQILVIMQILLNWGVDETKFLRRSLKKQEEVQKKTHKPSLVRKKSKAIKK